MFSTGWKWKSFNVSKHAAKYWEESKIVWNDKWKVLPHQVGLFLMNEKLASCTTYATKMMLHAVVANWNCLFNMWYLTWNKKPPYQWSFTVCVCVCVCVCLATAGRKEIYLEWAFPIHWSKDECECQFELHVFINRDLQSNHKYMGIHKV